MNSNGDKLQNLNSLLSSTWAFTLLFQETPSPPRNDLHQPNLKAQRKRGKFFQDSLLKYKKWSSDESISKSESFPEPIRSLLENLQGLGRLKDIPEAFQDNTT